MRRVTSVVTPVAHLVGPGKLKVVNGRLAFVAKDCTPLRLDPAALAEVYCYGAVGVTDEAMQELFRHDIQVAWLTPAGQACRGRLVRSDPPTTALRLLQYDAFRDPAWRRRWACEVVRAKVGSQAESARYYQRHGVAAAGDTLGRLQQILGQCSDGTAVGQLRGLEGAASAAWFALLGQVLQPPWQFAGRNRRPPRDPVNALLSLGYTFLSSRALARVEAAGLEPYLGGLHEYRPGRPSLVCDLVEPLRLPAVDRWVLRLCNKGLIAPEDFLPEGETFRLQPASFGRILQSWEQYWQDKDHDGRLRQWLQVLIGQLRERAPLVPEAPEGEDGGL